MTDSSKQESLSLDEMRKNPEELVLISGPVGSGKSQTLAYVIDKIQYESEKAHRATTTILHPLLERAVEMGVGLTLHVGQKPLFQEHDFAEPETFESDTEITADQLDALLNEFKSLTPPSAWELRYVLKDHPFEVAVETGKSIWFHMLTGLQPSADQEHVVMKDRGSCTIYGDK